ncbi:hypothetical protein [Romboutsia ilealis]|uniref:hypothetical protein n=1 Tax=Romboutsia ilealis TaxID=1115758 RepID=UPI00272C6ECC|nr:hypothetical protein [Romboutsia ilealis]
MSNEMEFLMDRIDGLCDENNEDIINEGKEIVKIYMEKKFPDDISSKFRNSFVSTCFRNIAIRYVGFTLLTNKFLNNLSNYIGNKKCLEVMAGKGSLSKGLMDRGVNVIPTDNFSWKQKLNLDDLWTDIENIDCLDAIRKYGKDVDFIIASWIPMDNTGYNMLKLMNEINPECKMIVIGEDIDGCTANDNFFNNLEFVFEDYYQRDTQDDMCIFGMVNAIPDFRSWSGIYDRVSIVRFKKDVNYVENNFFLL